MNVLSARSHRLVQAPQAAWLIILALVLGAAVGLASWASIPNGNIRSGASNVSVNTK